MGEQYSQDIEDPLLVALGYNWLLPSHSGGVLRQNLYFAKELPT